MCYSCHWERVPTAPAIMIWFDSPYVMFVATGRAAGHRQFRTAPLRSKRFTVLSLFVGYPG